MSVQFGRGNFIDGQWQLRTDILIESKNPSKSFAPVFQVGTDLKDVDSAVACAQKALKSWSHLSQSQRNDQLQKLKAVFIAKEQLLSHAISLEMGKPVSESLQEAKGLSARIDLMISHGLRRIATEHHAHVLAETRYHCQGVLGVLGPFNFPAHLINAHVIPALLTGNTVVVKPSEVCPWTGELYASCFEEAGFPKGVFNLVQGEHSVGSALAVHPGLDGLLFTGSYRTGRLLKELLLDQPHKILALELGGKNIAVVMDDAHIPQAISEIIQGAFLTTGQRCTATSRVMVHEAIAQPFTEMLLRTSSKLKPSDPFQKDALFGPLASLASYTRYLGLLEQAKAEQVDVLLENQVLEGGAFVTPSIYRISNRHPMKPYLQEELFGPNIALEVFSHLGEAIHRINESPYGLSNAVFSAKTSVFEQIYEQTRSGVLNRNRSTNGATGLLPFGGVKKSGNQRAAGIDAVRYTTFPVAINALYFAETAPPKQLLEEISAIKEACKEPLNLVLLRHAFEALFEKFGIIPDQTAGHIIILARDTFDKLSPPKREMLLSGLAQLLGQAFQKNDWEYVVDLRRISDDDGLLNSLSLFLEDMSHENGLHLTNRFYSDIHLPSGGSLPRSETMLHRLYRDQLVPAEKKTPVVDLRASQGPFLASIDKDPLVIFDAASQIATIGVGFKAGTFMHPYDCNQLDAEIMTNVDLAVCDDSAQSTEGLKSAHDHEQLFRNFLLDQGKGHFSGIAYGAGGAEANEIAFDLCRQNGPGGKRIIAFLGAFHGRTIMALHATHNPQKRSLFEFKGYEASFVPFPDHKNPKNEPPVTNEWISAWTRGEGFVKQSDDELLNREIGSLNEVKKEIQKGDVCAVIIEPLQCEGGDNYGTSRFFNGLRALTRGLNVPLIFDEVQTGFRLGRTFYWYHQFQLRDKDGKPEAPDCLTLGKKAQLGVCLTRWPVKRKCSPHVLQLQRGLLQGKACLAHDSSRVEKWTEKHLDELARDFYDLVSSPRACGYAFAFDMPNAHVANQFINQRFYRGFMVYIAGLDTIRFRMNMASSEAVIDQLFYNIRLALLELRQHYKIGHSSKPQEYIAPQWIDTETQSKTDLESPTQQIAEVSFEVLDQNNFDAFVPDVERMEFEAYEKGRRDTIPFLRNFALSEGGLGLIMKINHEGKKVVCGFAIGGPMELSQADGPKEDPMRGHHNSFYSADLVIDKAFRHQGLGHKLKEAQIKHVASMKNEQGSPRYHFMTGRNRVGFTQEIDRINKGLGAYVINVYSRQYGDEEGQSIYYRIPLQKYHPLKESDHDFENSAIQDCLGSIQNPFGEEPDFLKHVLKRGDFFGPIGSKLTLSNWTTPNIVRYAELLRTLMPKPLRHVYFTSGRDEVVDKGLRCLRFHRQQADLVIGFERQWCGHITAAARSLSDPMGQNPPFAWFDWPKVPHPGEAGEEASRSALEKLIATIDPERVLGIVVELMGERSGLTFGESYLSFLDGIRQKTQIPLVFIETTSGLYRNGQSLFYTESLPIKPNMVWWYTGAQLGHVLVDDRYYVDKPLTLISTWDGDEVSIIRNYWHMLEAKKLGEAGRVLAIENAVSKVSSPYTRMGRGAWQAFLIKDPKKTPSLIERARNDGLLLSEGLPGILLVCPKYNIDDQGLKALSEKLQELLG